MPTVHFRLGLGAAAVVLQPGGRLLRPELACRALQADGLFEALGRVVRRSSPFTETAHARQPPVAHFPFEGRCLQDEFFEQPTAAVP